MFRAFTRSVCFLVAATAVTSKAYAESPSEASQKIATARHLFADSIPEDRAQIEQLLNDAIRLEPNAAEAFTELGRYLLWQVSIGLRPQSEALTALEFADHVQELTPEAPTGDFLKCEALMTLGRQTDAETACSRAEMAFPNHLETEIFRARILAESAPQKALDAAQKALGLGTDLDVLSSSIATAIHQLHEPGEQGRALERFATIHPDRWLWHRAGLAYVSEKKFTEAKHAFETGIVMGNTLESRLQLALLQANQLKQYEPAIRNFETLLDLLAKRPDTRRSLFSGIHARLALVHLEMGNPTRATYHANEAIRSDVSETTLIQAIFESFEGKKLAYKLESAMQYASRENPFFGYAHLALGNLYSSRQEHTKAKQFYTKLIGLLPDDDFGYTKRAHSLYAAKEYQLALNDFDKALELKPAEASHHYNRACMLSLLGKTTESLASLRTALTLDRGLAKLAATDGDLANLRNSRDLQKQVAALNFSDNTKNTATASTSLPEKE